AVGEILDRIDDDTHEVGNVVRMQLWMFFRAAFAILPMWIVAGVTWWPAWLLFPFLALVTWLVVRPLLGEIAHRKVYEEMAWTDQASALEEGIAGRDDLRTSLGQTHVVQRVAALSAELHRRLLSVLAVERSLARRAGVLLHALLAGITVAGVAVAAGGGIPVSGLVTLFLVTATFVGQISQLANNLPDLQEGLGAVIRLRQMLAVEPEVEGGRDVPQDAALSLEFRDLDFAYDEGTFALRGIDLTVPAGETTAFVGRTGSGKSTLASFVARAVEPPRGTLFVGGIDVLDLDLQQLRRTVGTVTQRTEILAGTLADNITLYADLPRPQVERAVAELGLGGWVADLPRGLDTLLGPGGTTLSSGEEQLVAFARLLVRDVRLVVLDEATARMDPATERRVVAAADRLLRGRTGVLIAHRLGTIERASHIAVLDHGRLVQHGTRAELAREPGPFADLLEASRSATGGLPAGAIDSSAVTDDEDGSGVEAPTGSGAPAGARRRSDEVPAVQDVGDGPSLTRGILHALTVRPGWGLAGASLFLLGSLIGAQGAVTGLIWGHIVEGLQRGETPWLLTLALVACLLLMPIALAEAFILYPRWWVEVMLRTRMSVLYGQTGQRRLPRTPPGEVVARSMDADRYARYSDRWVDFINGLIVAAVTTVLAGTWVAGAVLLTVMVTSALASALGRPAAGRSAAEASTARSRFGRSLVSALESMRTVKLAAATPFVRRYLGEVDSGRVAAAVTEHRIQTFLQGVPMVMVQCGLVATWAIHVAGGWGLATTLLVGSAVAGFDWFGRVAGMVVTEAPGTRAWQVETARFAGGADLMDLPPGVDLVTGDAPSPAPVSTETLERLDLRGLSALHEDGTIGVSDVD
ncbi:MAG: ATP-binding cassette domain-containing protein, partial [Janibacter sp.]